MSIMAIVDVKNTHYGGVTLLMSVMRIIDINNAIVDISNAHC